MRTLGMRLPITRSLVVVALCACAACEDEPVMPGEEQPEALSVSIMRAGQLAATPGADVRLIGHVLGPLGSPKAGIQVEWQIHDPASCTPECVPLPDVLDPTADFTDQEGATSTAFIYPGLVDRYLVRLRVTDPRHEGPFGDSTLIVTVFEAWRKAESRPLMPDW